MAHVFADRVRETSTTTGTGALTLAGAISGYQTFSSAIGDTNTCHYAIHNLSADEWEVGLGTVATSGPTLTRTSVFTSSNSNSAVNFSAGTKDVFVTYPADKTVTSDGTQTLTNKSIVATQLTGTVANARLDAQLQDVAGLGVTDGNFIVGNGSNFVAESGATVRTSLGLGTAAVLDTGISNTNVAKFTSGVADNDFLRVDGTDIEGRSASEVLSDIGAQASDAQLTDVAGLAVTDGNFIVGNGSNFVAESGATVRTSLGLGTSATLDTGISNTNVAKFTSGVADNDFLRVDGTDIEGRSASEVLSDIGAQASDAQLTDVAGLAVTDGNFIVGNGSNFVAESGATVRTSLGLGTAAVLDTGISNTNVAKFTSGAADDDFLRIDGTSIEGRSASELLSDVGANAVLRPNAQSYIINGDMRHSQRSTSTTGVGATANEYAGADRWQTSPNATAGRLTQTQDTDVPAGYGFSFSTKLACTTADTSIASTEYLQFRQHIEGQNVQSLDFGTANATTLTVAFWVKGNASATYTCSLTTQSGDKQVSQRFSVTTSWAKVILNYPADTSTAIVNSNASGFQLSLWLHAGSAFTSGTQNTGAWASSTNANIANSSDTSFFDATSRTFFITGVQLEAGTYTSATIPKFQFEDHGTSLARCQRYFYLIAGDDNDYPVSTIVSMAANQFHAPINFPTTMRAVPTFTLDGTLRTQSDADSATFTSGLAVNGAADTANGMVLKKTGLSGLSSGNAGMLQFKADDSKMEFDADL